MASQSQAKGQAGSDAGTSQREQAGGWVVVDGEPRAQSQGTCEVAGIRPGVDGPWKIKQAEHQYSRSTGFTTRMDLYEHTPGTPTVDMFDPKALLGNWPEGSLEGTGGGGNNG
jgi:phage protein D